MHTIKINIEDSYPKSVVLSTVDAVREKVLEAEKSVQNGNFVGEEAFWNNIDRRMKQHENSISLLRDNPYLYRQSIYFEGEVYRDLT